MGWIMNHRLKCWPEPFQDLWDGKKTAEVRKNDRDFAPGDWCTIEEYDPDAKVYLGRQLTRRISHVQAGFGLKRGYVVLSYDTKVGMQKTKTAA